MVLAYFKYYFKAFQSYNHLASVAPADIRADTLCGNMRVWQELSSVPETV